MLFETCYHNFTDSSLYESEVRTCTVGRLDEYCGEVVENMYCLGTAIKRIMKAAGVLRDAKMRLK